MSKGKLIGRGMTAEVYEWDQNKVLKLYFGHIPSNYIEREAKIGQSVYEAGVSSPIVYDIMDYENRKGILFQHIKGKSLLKFITSKPWNLIYYARCMARVHFKIHGCSINNLQSQNERLKNAIKDASNLSKDVKIKVLDYLDTLPSGYSVCHGDFHPDNVIVTDKDMVTIDWTNAYYGNQLSDVARTCIVITTPFMPPGTSKTILFLSKLLKSVLYKVYLKEYIKLTKFRRQDIDAWILPVAAARLREQIPGEENWLLEIIHKELKRLGI